MLGSVWLVSSGFSRRFWTSKCVWKPWCSEGSHHFSLFFASSGPSTTLECWCSLGSGCWDLLRYPPIWTKKIVNFFFSMNVYKIIIINIFTVYSGLMDAFDLALLLKSTNQLHLGVNLFCNTQIKWTFNISLSFITCLSYKISISLLVFSNNIFLWLPVGIYWEFWYIFETNRTEVMILTMIYKSHVIFA